MIKGIIRYCQRAAGQDCNHAGALDFNISMIVWADNGIFAFYFF